MIYFWVGIAGSLGAILRYLIGVLLFTNNSFPYATLCVNLIGSFLLAWLTMHVSKKLQISETTITIIGTGFVGSFTTFSTFSIETVKMLQAGNISLGLAYIFVSIMGGIIASRLGYGINKEVKK